MTSGATKDRKPTLATNIQRARKSAGYTQRSLSLKIGVDALAISRWERGVSTPSEPNLYALAETLGVTVAWLYTPNGVAA